MYLFLQQILISEQTSTSLSTVYNKIQIWGKVNEPDYYTKDVSILDNIYNANSDMLDRKKYTAILKKLCKFIEFRITLF